MKDLLPPGVEVAQCAIEAEPEEPLHPDEEALAGAMSPARRREFAAGRACARRALAALGTPGVAVLRGERRMPRWPAGVVGSITHSGGFCAAAVARASAFAGVGIDAERFAPLSEGVLQRITNEAERDALEALPGGEPRRWGAVLFSAKESLYKAYFPLTGRFLGFRDVAVTLAPDAGGFRAELLRDDVPDAAGLRAFAGRFALEGALVQTGLAIPAHRDG